MKQTTPFILAMVLAAPALVIETYGEMHIQHSNYADQGKSATGSPADSRWTGDLPRAVLEIDALPRPDLAMEMEIEFEHGGTGSAMEVENDEFGEVESEIEKGGEVVLEQMHFTKSVTPELKLRFGKFYLPIGAWNNNPHPMDYLGAAQPQSEQGIHPATWTGMGIMALGQVGNLNWNIALTEGVDATQFNSSNWIGGSQQGRFEELLFNSPAITLALHQENPMVNWGISAYGTNAIANRPKDEIDGFAGLGILSAYALRTTGNLFVRAGLSWGFLQDAELISTRNQNLSRNLNVPRTPVAEQAMQANLNLGYKLCRHGKNDNNFVIPYLEGGYINSMLQSPHTVATPRAEQWIYRAGVTYSTQNSLRFTIEHQIRSYPSGLRSEQNTSAGIAYQFDFNLNDQE